MAYMESVEDSASNSCVLLFGLLLVGLWGMCFLPILSLLLPLGIIGAAIVILNVASERDWVAWVHEQDD